MAPGGDDWAGTRISNGAGDASTREQSTRNTGYSGYSRTACWRNAAGILRAGDLATAHRRRSQSAEAKRRPGAAGAGKNGRNAERAHTDRNNASSQPDAVALPDGRA